MKKVRNFLLDALSLIRVILLIIIGREIIILKNESILEGVLLGLAFGFVFFFMPILVGIFFDGTDVKIPKHLFFPFNPFKEENDK